MKKSVLFLLVNGIGFGHFKRALVIADAFDKAEYDVRFVVQASATDIFTSRGYPVYSFPLLYSIKHNNARHLIYKLLDSLIVKLQPSLVFEDTYPEDDYLNLPSLCNIPRMLIIRRVDNKHLENMLFRGYFSCYDQLFFMDNKAKVIESITNCAVRTYIDYSEKSHFVGDVFDITSKDQRDIVQKKYNLLMYSRNIVFNCGAGGWHIGEDVSRIVFDSGFSAVKDIAYRHPEYQFIFVTGPYSGWGLPELQNIDNIRVVKYEENLSALFQCADVCVIRPGYNAVMECLAGKSDVILLPSISYMENQSDWSNQLVSEYGLSCVKIGDVSGLKKCIEECLSKKKRNELIVESNENHIVELALRYMEGISNSKHDCMMSFSGFGKTSEYFDRYTDIFIQNEIVKCNGDTFPIINIGGQINLVDYAGKIVFIYRDENHFYESYQSIRNQNDFFSYGIVPIVIYEISYTNCRDTLMKINTLLSRGSIVLNILFGSDSDGKEEEFLDSLIKEFECGRLKRIGLNQIVQEYLKKTYSYKYVFNSIGAQGVG